VTRAHATPSLLDRFGYTRRCQQPVLRPALPSVCMVWRDGFVYACADSVTRYLRVGVLC